MKKYVLFFSTILLAVSFFSTASVFGKDYSDDRAAYRLMMKENFPIAVVLKNYSTKGTWADGNFTQTYTLIFNANGCISYELNDSFLTLIKDEAKVKIVTTRKSTTYFRDGTRKERTYNVDSALIKRKFRLEFEFYRERSANPYKFDCKVLSETVEFEYEVKPGEQSTKTITFTIPQHALREHPHYDYHAETGSPLIINVITVYVTEIVDVFKDCKPVKLDTKEFTLKAGAKVTIE